jgi:cytochrome c-type biogenesis protein
MDLTLGAALLAGLLSFLSPCVLPVVPAYLGQLGIVATSRQPTGAPGLLPVTAAAAGVGPLGPPATPVAGPLSAPVAHRLGVWRAMPNAIAFVLGFGVVFTVLGAAVYVVAGPLRDNLTLFRQISGIVLIILGLNLMGVLHLDRLWRSWKPLERFGRGAPGTGHGGVVGGFALGAAFAVGWTPCIGPTLSAVLALAAAGTSPQVVALLVAYSFGLGVPFLLMALAVDRAPVVTRPLLRYSRQIEVVGGGLVVFMGIALIFDLLGWFSRSLAFLWPQV